MELEPIDPETALKLYIAEKETAVSDATAYSHKSRLGFFVEWCDERAIENLNELTGRKLQEFRLWRRNVGDLTKVSEKTQMDTVRVFVKWLESIDAVDQDLHLKVRSPDVTPRENSRDVLLDVEDAEARYPVFEAGDTKAFLEQRVVVDRVFEVLLSAEMKFVGNLEL